MVVDQELARRLLADQLPLVAVAQRCCFGTEDRARFVARIDAAGVYDPYVWTRAAGWAASFASATLPGTSLEPVAHHIARELGST